MFKIIKPLRNGQITLPIDVRRKLDIDEKTLLQLRLVNHKIHLTPIKLSQIPDKGSLWLSELYELFDKPRKKAQKYSSKEINKDIEKAVKTVQHK